MMAALVEGREYGLSSPDPTSACKSVVYVKLTDSALRTIEEYLKSKDETSGKPAIQFHGNQGEMRLPVPKTSTKPGGLRTFQFSLSAIQSDPNGSFQGVQQSHAGGQLEGLGIMSHKVCIHAKDDVFQVTKQKMTLAEEESKEKCAKEIKPSGPNIGCKIKKVLKKGSVPSKHHQVSPQPSSKHHQVTPQPSSKHYQPSSLTKTSINNRAPPSRASPADNHRHDSHRHDTHSTNNSSSPMSLYNSSHKPSGLSSRSSPTPAVINMPYRERVIHLLAVRPYKKPELLARLHRDGIKEKDRHALGPVLQEVAICNRDDTYVLPKRFYNEVRPDWPFYSDTEKQLLKRRMPSETNHASTPSPAVSPVHSSQGSPAQKRLAPVSGDDKEAAPSKKQRIAHAKSTSDPMKAASPKLNGSVPASKQQQKHNHNSILDSSLSSSKDNCQFADSPESPPNSKENKQLDDTTADKSDFSRLYPSITNIEQRQKYKQEFNSEYEEYRTLHSNIEKVTLVFHHLKDELKATQVGSNDYENIKNRILSKYRSVTKDPKYMEQRKRCDYLHRKLGHVKKLIVEYDRVQMAKS